MLTLHPLAATIVESAVPKLPAPIKVTVLMYFLLLRVLFNCLNSAAETIATFAALPELYKVLCLVTSHKLVI